MLVLPSRYIHVHLFPRLDQRAGIAGLGALSGKIAKASHSSALSSYQYEGGQQLVEADAQRLVRARVCVPRESMCDPRVRVLIVVARFLHCVPSWFDSF